MHKHKHIQFYLYRYWVNQQVLGKTTHRVDTFIYLNGTLVFGQDQDDILSGYDSMQSFSGEITNFNVWDGVISQEQVKFIIHFKCLLIEIVCRFTYLNPDRKWL